MLGFLHGMALLVAPVGLAQGNAVTPGVEATRYAALPMRNLTADREAAASILTICEVALQERGASFVPMEELEAVLRSNRIRYTDSISSEAARKVGETTGARFILLGTLFFFEPEPVPRISLALRIIDAGTGRRIQSSIITLRGDDFAGLLGLGAIQDIDELVLEVLERLLDMFDDQGAPREDPSGPDPGGRKVPRTSISRFVRAGFDPSSIESLGVLPLVNRTNEQGVGLVFSEILAHECFRAAGIQVVEQSELRASMVRQRIRSVAGLDLELLDQLGEDLGTRYFALGSVDRYREAAFIHGERFPEIEAFVRIIDITDGTVVASVGVHRTGLDYERLLGLGDVRDPVALAARVASEIIAAIGMGK